MSREQVNPEEGWGWGREARLGPQRHRPEGDRAGIAAAETSSGGPESFQAGTEMVVTEAVWAAVNWGGQRSEAKRRPTRRH